MTVPRRSATDELRARAAVGTGPPTGTLGQGLARAVAAKDGDGLKALLGPDLDFRAVTPGRYWESADAGTVVDQIILGTWFSPERRITELVAVECEQVGTLERVRYQLGVERPDGRFLVEQQAYLESAAGRISALRIVCSGYLPV